MAENRRPDRYRFDDLVEPESGSADGQAESQPAPQTRRKLTGAELESRFDGWRMRLRTGRAELTDAERARRSRRLLAGALGLGVLVAVTVTGVVSEQQAGVRAENARVLAERETQVAEAEADAVAADVDLSGPLAELAVAASDDAEQVAGLQQEFAGLQHAAETFGGAQDGAPSNEVQAVAEHRRTLAPFFAEQTWLVTDDEQAYQWTTVAHYDEATAIDPRFTWYTRHDRDTVYPADSYTWQVDTVTVDPESVVDPGTADRARVLWTNRLASTGDVLAWAEADYEYDRDTETGRFTSLGVTTTGIGANYERRDHPDLVPERTAESEPSEDAESVPPVPTFPDGADEGAN